MSLLDIRVNGERHQVAQDTSLAELIASLDITAKRIAVELNREIVPRSELARVRLGTGDRVEIVRAVGGG